VDQEQKRIASGILNRQRSNTSDIVIDKEKLWINRAVQQLKAQLRDQELAEIIEKQKGLRK
jgi:hypothetical protein